MKKVLNGVYFGKIQPNISKYAENPILICDSLTLSRKGFNLVLL